MPTGLRKFVLSVHLTSSLGWIGAVVAYVALGVSAVTTQDAETVRGAWIAMELAGWYVIVPMALSALLSGIVISLGTPWGLFRHYWVLISLVLTIFAATILMLHMPDVSAMTRMVRQADAATLAGGHGGDLFHAIGGLVVLLMITVLNVYKPQGLTAYGWRTQQAQRAKLALRSSVANQQELSAPVATVSGPSALAASDPNGRAADERSARPRRTAT